LRFEERILSIGYQNCLKIYQSQLFVYARSAFSGLDFKILEATSFWLMNFSLLLLL
jgi:hypothetical protein